MGELPGGWEWRRWQLVRVDVDAGALVVDAIELADDEDVAGGLVTLKFIDDQVASPDAGPHQQLRRWARVHDGLCDAFHRPSVPFGRLAMFQGDDSLLLSVATMGEDEGLD